MIVSRRLRVSSSARTAQASRRRIAAGLCSGALRGSIGTPGLPTAIRAIRIASARENGGSSRR